MIWLLIGYMFLFIHRPFEFWPALGAMRIELVYMLITGAIWLVHPGKRFTFNPLHLAFALFAGAVLVCGLASPWSDSCWTTLDVYFKILIFYLVLVTVVHEEKDLKLLALGFLGVMTLYMLHSLWEFHCGRFVVRMGIVRMIGIDSTRGDPNAFGASIVLALAFVPAVWAAYSSLRVRGFLVGFMLLSLLCIALTGSRGAFVGLIVCAMAVAWRSQWRWKLAVLGLGAAPLFWLALPDKLQNRFETIVDPSVGPANAQTSAQGRIEGLLLGIELLEKNTLLGVGPGAWRPATKRLLESHNLYGQLMGEMGMLGILTFGGVLLAFGLNLLRIRRLYREHPHWGNDFLVQMSKGVGLAVFLLLFEGNFGHNLFRHNWVWFAAFLTIADACARQRADHEAYYGAGMEEDCQDQSDWQPGELHAACAWE